MRRNNHTKKDEPQLCPECPFIHPLLDIIQKSIVTYTNTPSKRSTVWLCAEMRRLAAINSYDPCPHYPKTETILRYIV